MSSGALSACSRLATRPVAVCACLIHLTALGPASALLRIGIGFVCPVALSTSTVNYRLPCASRSKGPAVPMDILASGSVSFDWDLYDARLVLASAHG